MTKKFTIKKEKLVENEVITLQDIPEDSLIYCEVSDGSSYVKFHHCDGMYSYCTTELGGTIHLGRFTNLEKFKDGYKII